MHDDVPVYDHVALSPYARRLLVVLAAVAALVLGLVTPARAADGHVVGTVTGPGAVPIEDVWVDLYDPDDLAFIGGDVTNAQGNYDIVVPPGSYLVVFFPVDGNYEPELYDDIHDFDDIDDIAAATPVVVPDGGSAEADAELTPYASISGHLTMDAADPNDAVQVYDDEGDIAGWGWVEPDGSYQVNGLGAGTYQVAFNRLSGFALSAAEFYDDHVEEDGLASADPITLAGGEARADVDGVLVEGGHVTGILQDSDGQPIRCRLQAFTADRSLVTRSGWSDATTGEFDITGLTTGSYLVRVVNGQDCQNGLQYVDVDRGALSAVLSSADPVATTLGGDTPLSPTLVYDLGPQPVNTVLPSISGAPVVNAVLTANRGTWSPSSHLKYRYQWLAGGTAIPGATRRTYRVNTVDVGKTIAVRVTVTRGSRTASATSAPTASVTVPAGMPLAHLSGPRVSGLAAIDQTLTVDPGVWSVPGATFTYVWTSGSKVVKTTSSPSLKVPDTLYQQPLWLTVVASRPGYTNGQALVPVTMKVQQGRWGAIRAPKIKGKARVGSTLKVRTARVSPKARLTFQWYRDGKAIPGASGRTYDLTTRDAGHRMHVFVKYGRSHYMRVGLVSKETPKVTR
jgi:hypothetical protein